MLIAQNLSASRGRRVLFADLSFSVAAGHWLRIHGANGVGKTTLLRRLCGLTGGSGVLLWRDQPLNLSPDFANELVWCGHLDALHGLLTPLENLISLCALAGQRPPLSAIENALGEVGLEHRMQLPVAALSRGQRQRTSLARLLLLPGALWLLDEPTTSLDAQGIIWLQGKMQHHLRAGGVLVYASHQSMELGECPGINLGLQGRA